MLPNPGPGSAVVKKAGQAAGKKACEQININRKKLGSHGKRLPAKRTHPRGMSQPSRTITTTPEIVIGPKSPHGTELPKKACPFLKYSRNRI